jgi:hypothetical protein
LCMPCIFVNQWILCLWYPLFAFYYMHIAYTYWCTLGRINFYKCCICYRFRSTFCQRNISSFETDLWHNSDQNFWYKLWH